MLDLPLILKINLESIRAISKRCGTAHHFNNKSHSPQDPHAFLQVQVIETINNSVSNECMELLWHREKWVSGKDGAPHGVGCGVPQKIYRPE